MPRVFNIVMRIVSTVLGVVLVLIGLVWIGQGLHVGPDAIMRGFMVSNRQWAVWGALLALVGVSQVIWTNTRQRWR